MLYKPSEQVTHCYRRAVECGERAMCSVDLTEKDFYLAREEAWLKLARSFEFSERLDRVLNVRRKLRNWPATRRIPTCPACHIEMRVHAVEPSVADTSMIVFERAYVHCPNCGRARSYSCD
jgi:hypothetical protein